MKLKLIAVVLAGCIGLIVATTATDADDPKKKPDDAARVVKTTQKGDPGLVRPVAIAMAPGNVLLIGDDRGKQIVAIKLPKAKKGEKIKKIANINTKVGDRMGNPKARVMQMALSEDGDRAYLLVPNYRTRKITIVSVDAAGKLTEIDLSNVDYAKVALPIQVGRRGAGINDIKWAGDKIIVTGTTNAQFNADIISIPAPIGSGKHAVVSAETYHWSHRAWETRAPIRRFCVHQADKKSYIFGGYSCTPIVRFDVSDLKDGTKLKGSTITDFGGGELIMDIFTYEKEKKTYLLANTMRRGCIRIESEYMMEKDAVNEDAAALLQGRTGGPVNSPKTKMVDGYKNVINMVRMDDKQALVLHSPDGGTTQHIEAMPLP